MIETFVNTATLQKFEPSIIQFKDVNVQDFSDQIDEALGEIIDFLKDQRKKIRLYCLSFPLQTDLVATANITGLKSDEDIIERLIWIVNIISGSGTFNLYGTNDNDNETWSLISTLAVADGISGQQHNYFDSPYKFYRVDYVGSECEYSSYLIERSFYYAHVYHSLELIYNSFVTQKDDMWDMKAKRYENKYNIKLQSMAATYDEDDDGVIEKFETERVSEVNFLR